MEKFDLLGYNVFGDLPLALFDGAGYSIYLLDKNWTYLYVNNFVKRNLGKRSEGMIGQNMWSFFPELKNDPIFIQLRLNTENGKKSNLITTSPLTAQRLNITGHILSDCYVFTSSILPKKEDVMNDLRGQLKNRQPSF